MTDKIYVGLHATHYLVKIPNLLAFRINQVCWRTLIQPLSSELQIITNIATFVAVAVDKPIKIDSIAPSKLSFWPKEVIFMHDTWIKH